MGMKKETFIKKALCLIGLEIDIMDIRKCQMTELRKLLKVTLEGEGERKNASYRRAKKP